MCNHCRQTTAYVRINDDVTAQVTHDSYDYDEYEEYTDEQLDEKIEFKVESIWMTRRAFREHLQSVFL